MAAIDRDALLEQLERFEAEDDAAVLAAARAAQALVDDVDGGWGAVIPAAKETKAAAGKKRTKVPTGGEIGETIAALLARADISDDARDDLIAFQADHGAGRLDPNDEGYIRALAGRLG